MEERNPNQKLLLQSHHSKTETGDLLFSIQCNVMVMSKKASLSEYKLLKNYLTTVHISRTWICICAKCFFINPKEVLRMTRPEVRAFPQLNLPLHHGSRSSLIQVEGSVWNGLLNGLRM